MTTTDPDLTTIDRLDQIEARAQAATKGPWTTAEDWAYVASGSDSVIHGYYEGDCPACGEGIEDDGRVALSVEDAEFIAAARTDVPALVAAVRAVLDKHQPLDAIHTVTGKPLQVCSGCGRDRDWMPWPCPTVQAVEDALVRADHA